MIYIAGPYFHADHFVREERVIALTRYAGYLMNKGEIVYSPITHNHPIALECTLPLGWDYWRKFDTFFINCCQRMHVLCLPGYEESVGVSAEMQLARHANKPIVLINPNGYTYIY